jgi:PhnB protein
MKIEPYLFFDGRCEEALDFYKRVFGAERTFVMRYKESPEAPSMPLLPGWQEKVMHASLQIGETMLMTSDGSGPEAPEFKGFSLSVAMADEQAAARVFDALAEGGEVGMPLGKTFFSPCLTRLPPPVTPLLYKMGTTTILTQGGSWVPIRPHRGPDPPEAGTRYGDS